MRLITDRFNSVLQRKGMHFYLIALINMPTLVITIFKYRKLEEFLSFIIWEICYVLRFFRSKNYIRFKNNDPIIDISDNQLIELCRKNELAGYFEKKDVCASQLDLKWVNIFSDKNETLWGSIAANTNFLYRSHDKGKSAKEMFAFPSKIQSIYIDNRNSIFVCSEGTVFKSKDHGISFYQVLELSSRTSYFRDCGFTEDDIGRLFIAEYSFNESDWPSAWIYWSVDYGDTWEKSDFLIDQGANRHAHIIKYFKGTSKLCLTDGDNKKRLWINDTMQDFSSKASGNNINGWRLVNKTHIKMGGYLSAENIQDDMILGTDYLGGTNFIVKTNNCKKFRKFVISNPYRRNPVVKIIRTRSKSGYEVWACLRNWSRSKYSKGAILRSNDNAETWFKFIEYNGLKYDIDIISNSILPLGYFFIRIKQLGGQEKFALRIDR